VLVLPLGLLALNLLAALASNPVFRQQTPLLVFHLSLLTIVLLVAAGRLSYLKGELELAEGEEFGGTLTAFEAGPWHPFHLDKLHFANNGFSIAYAPGQRRLGTRNRVSYTDADGAPQQAEIGDTTPLVLQGYRFYTTPNKGFAPTFLWHPSGASEPILGAVHLPSYPANEYRQSQEWTLPGSGIKLWTQLSFDEAIIDPDKASEFRLPKQYQLIVRIGDARHELQPGQSVELPGGRLIYAGLLTWMGYTVFYDWTIHWLLATCVVAVLALGWHFWQKFAARPWDN
jgi:cytochrome c biogenesis protein